MAKRNGEIVDYYNVFRNMKKTLKDYTQGEKGLQDAPVQDKQELLRLLDDAIEQSLAFCWERNMDIPAILENRNVFKNIGLFNDYADLLLGNDECRRTFNIHENTICSLYEACKPEVLGRDAVVLVAVFQYLRGVIESIVDRQDIDAVNLRIAELLDESVVVDKPQQFTAAQGRPHIRLRRPAKPGTSAASISKSSRKISPMPRTKTSKLPSCGLLLKPRLSRCCSRM